MPSRVFGYGDRTGLTSALRTACRKASQPYLTPHETGRQGGYTNPAPPDRIYALVETGEAGMRTAMRTGDQRRDSSARVIRKSTS